VDSYGDYRRLLERKDVDAVLVATPDHWHSPIMVDACAAGKDVYVEKPVSNTLPAAQRMVEAAQKYKRVVQVGCQQRSWPHFQECCKMIQDGLLGKVTHALLLFAGGGTQVTQPPVPVPAGLDWEMWQGPAPRHPYSPSRRRWRAYYDYGGGLVTDWGVHLTDIAHMALNSDTTGPSLTGASAQYVSLPVPQLDQIPDAFICNWQYEKFVMSFTNVNPPIAGFSSSGNYFYGPRGILLVNRSGYKIWPSTPRAGQPAAPPIEAKEFRPPRGGTAGGADAGTILHTRNFLDCIKSRQKPNCEMQIGFYSTLPCLIALLAIQQRRSFVWDGKTAKPV
jgi:predicted dehydrogenase